MAMAIASSPSRPLPCNNATTLPDIQRLQRLPRLSPTPFFLRETTRGLFGSHILACRLQKNRFMHTTVTQGQVKCRYHYSPSLKGGKAFPFCTKEFTIARSCHFVTIDYLGATGNIWLEFRNAGKRNTACSAVHSVELGNNDERHTETDPLKGQNISLVDASVTTILGEADGKSDLITNILKSKPSQVERKFLIGDRLYTLKEKEQLQAPFWQKLPKALGLVRIEGFIRGVKETAEKKLSEGKERKGKVGISEDDTKEQQSVYLSDLLREYKGDLYVPVEAFSGNDPEVQDFNRNLAMLPIMSFDDFLKAMKSNQVEMLTSRGILSHTAHYTYRDFIVQLKRIPGDRSLQRRTWAMHLTEEEAQVVLQDYIGPQREIETYYTPYAILPPRSPHPVASSISGKVMLELSVVSGLVATTAFTVGALASSVAFMLISCMVVVVAHVLWPLAFPFLWPVAVIFLKLTASICNFLLGGVARGRARRKGLLGLMNDVYGFLISGALFSNIRILAAIFVVLVAMAALAKFTLTRRPKDFTKWDLWQAIEFGHSKPQARVEGSTGVGFEDVAGIDEIVEELQELVNYLKDADRFNQMGTKPPHGVLLEGPPGCGKTLLAKAIAGEAGVPFYQMAGSEFVEVLVGVGAARVRDLFKRAKVNRPAVVFIDEIDALGAKRHGGGRFGEYNAGAQERETTLNQLLIELDGFDTGKGVVFLGATNRMDLLDPALLRPGRFDRKVTVKPPRAKGRYDILQVHAKHVKLSQEVDLWAVAKSLPGWTGAQLSQLLQEGALMAVRNGHEYILQEDLTRAMDRLTVGTERLGIGHGLPVHQRIASTEIGIALTCHLLRRIENAQLEFCDHVSIIPRGETLSRTIFRRMDDEAYFFERRSQLIHRMQVFLGARAAEEVMFGRDTSDWSKRHLANASWLARKLITIWNLEGPLTVHGERPAWSLEPHFVGPPLDFEGWLYDDYGLVDPALNRHIDNEVAECSEALLNKIYMRTLKMLQQHHAALAKTIYVILDKQEIYGDELELILDAYPSGIPVQLVENEEDPGALPRSEGLIKLGEGKKTELAGAKVIGTANSEQVEVVNFMGDRIEASQGSYGGMPKKHLSGNGNAIVEECDGSLAKPTRNGLGTTFEHVTRQVRTQNQDFND
eukprot:c28693_g1_i1 orf=891-4328(-)